MDFLGFGGSLLSAGASLLGGKMTADSNAKAQRLNMIANAELAAKNEALQREFAQNGIQWKVQDAIKAGLHPLAALGAQTQSFSPISVGSSPFSGDSSMGTAVAAAGQDLSRALNATRSEGERNDAYSKTVKDLTVQKMGLENELLASQIAKVNQAGTPPPMPTGNPSTRSAASKLASGDKLIKDEAMKRTISDPEKPSQEPGVITDVGHTRTAKGWAPVLSKDAQERYEDDWPGIITWNMRNRIPQSFGFMRKSDPPFAAPPGREWYYHPVWQEYRLRKAPSPSTPGKDYSRVRGYSNSLRMN